MSRKQQRSYWHGQGSGSSPQASFNDFVDGHNRLQPVEPPVSIKAKRLDVPYFERGVQLNTKFANVAREALAQLGIFNIEQSELIHNQPSVVLLDAPQVRKATRSQIDSGSLTFDTIVQEIESNAPDSFGEPLSINTDDTNIRFTPRIISKELTEIGLSIIGQEQLIAEKEYLARALAKFSGELPRACKESSLGLFTVKGEVGLGEYGIALAKFLLEGQQITINPVLTQNKSLK